MLLLLSGAAGAVWGASHPTWHWAVEIAQLNAGIVQYGPASPMALLGGQIWSLVHQLVAVFLVSGGTERAASLVLSAVTGMLSVQALAMFGYALLRDAWLAGAGTFVVLGHGQQTTV